jgi:hypothetical protein
MRRPAWLTRDINSAIFQVTGVDQFCKAVNRDPSAEPQSAAEGEEAAK